MKGLGDQVLAHIGAVGIGGVDEVDPELDGPAQRCFCHPSVERVPPDSLAGDPHGTDTMSLSDRPTGRSPAVWLRRRG